MVHSFRATVAEARRHGDLYFAALLSQDRILKAFGTARAAWQGWVYTPAITVWVFLSQCLSPDHSCRDAVARLIAWRLARGLSPCSADTGSLLHGAGRSAGRSVHALVRDTGRQVEEESPATWLWHGRKVRVVDGSTITMPDTAENQAVYPQQKTQKPGCGFPIARILVIFSLSVGTVLEAAIGKYQGKQTGENSLFRKLYDALDEGDIVLADRYFSGWSDIALPLGRGIDIVVRKHQHRATDFRTGKRLGKDDHLVFWKRPQRPKWMSVEQYATLPDELTLREVRIHVAQKGFRTKSLVVVTTLLDAEEYPPEEIALLYRRRWQAEVFHAQCVEKDGLYRGGRWSYSRRNGVAEIGTLVPATQAGKFRRKAMRYVTEDRVPPPNRAPSTYPSETSVDGAGAIRTAGDPTDLKPAGNPKPGAVTAEGGAA